MKTKIVVDSAANLYALEGVDFACVPLKIITDHEEYRDDGTLDAVGMATTLRTYKGKTSTSCPNVSDWLEAFEGADEVYAITITGTLSGCYNAAQLAAEEYQQEHPGKRVFVLDSLSTGPEQQLLAEHLRDELAETVYLNILNQAQQYIYIYTPYLAVGEEMLDALKNAAKRGVDVRLVLPGIPDKKLVFRLSRSYYVPLLRAGVRIYEFTPGFLHSKCYVSDDHLAVVGSINMDYRSLFLHFECGVLLQKNSQVAVLRDDVRATLPQCREIQVTECRTSLPGTVLDSVLRLLSPLM